MNVMFKRGTGAFLVIVLLTMVIAACSSANNNNAGNQAGGDANADSKEPVKLTFMFWGSAYEKKAIEEMVDSFNKSHPHIVVTAEHVPNDFETKINTLMATNELPDISYLNAPMTLQWGKEGKLLDMTAYLDQYPDLNNRLPQSKLYAVPDQLVATTIAGANASLYYNKDLFEEAGLPMPPSKAEDAWDWDEFIRVAQTLTIDKNGKRANEDGFDRNNITQYGFSFPKWALGWYPFLRSNGADITNEDGTQYTGNSPEAVQVFQSLRDLIYEYHVSPSPTAQANMPSTNVSLQTERVAMALDGAWALLDISQSDMNYGISVLPKFKDPKTVFVASAGVVYASTKHPDEAMEFYMYYNSPEVTNLYSNGLWMPIEQKYYDQQEYIDKWTNNEVHPPEFKEASIDYMKHADTMLDLQLRNYREIDSQLSPLMEQVWFNEVPVQDIMDAIGEAVQPLLQGKYNQAE